MDDFYITISNKDLDETFPNETSNWQSKLPYKIHTNNYEVGIAQISYPFSWYNIFDDQEVTIVYYEDNKSFRNVFTINKGFYSIQNLIDLINYMLKKISDEKKLSEQSLLYLENYGGIEKLQIDFSPQSNKLIGIEFSDLLNNILGIDRAGLSRFIIKVLSGGSSLTYVCPHTYDITVGYHSIFVYTDIIEPIIVGDKQVPLLKIIEFPSDVSYNQQITCRYRNIEYRKVNRSEIKTIEIQFADDAGENIRFNKNSEIIIVLHFKEINKSNQNHPLS